MIINADRSTNDPIHTTIGKKADALLLSHLILFTNHRLVLEKKGILESSFFLFWRMRVWCKTSIWFLNACRNVCPPMSQPCC